MKFYVRELSVLAGVILSLFWGSVLAVNTAEEREPLQLIFRNGDEGYAVYRTPNLLMTKEGTLLAFTQGRVHSHHDEGVINVVLKRSFDEGKTWGPLQVVAEDGDNPCKTGGPVLLDDGRIMLVWLWNEYIGNDEDLRTTRMIYIQFSDDEGATWSERRDITPQVFMDHWGWYGIGPAKGLVKQHEPNKGRIIVPARHQNTLPNQRTSSHIIYSDDQGETWHIGAIALRNRTTESTVVELSNGDLLMNSRNSVGGQNARVVSVSKDGGQTFESVEININLIEPDGCQGELLFHSHNHETNKHNILFSNPNHTSNRVHGSIKLSEDDGQTWTRRFVYSNPAPAFSGYSSPAVLNEDGDIGVLFETGESHEKPLRWYGKDGGIGFRVVRFDEINEPLHHIDEGNWVVYDGSTLLEDTWPKWAKARTTSGATDGPESVYYSVVDDPVVEGNKLLQGENLTWSAREGWEHDWQLGWDRTGLTLVFRTKPTEGLLQFSAGGSSRRMLYISPRNGAFMEALTFTYPDQLRFNMMNKSVTHNSHDWTIYRLTMMRNQVFLYINEDPDPVMFGFTTRESPENRLLFGMDTSEPYGSYIDWMVWDLSGAYPPGQGPGLPETLTGLDYVSSSSQKLVSHDHGKINIYPNPASGFAMIEFETDRNQPVSVDLFDVTGKLISTLMQGVYAPDRYEIELNVTTMPPGIYICRVVSGDRTYNQRLVVVGR